MGKLKTKLRNKSLFYTKIYQAAEKEWLSIRHGVIRALHAAASRGEYSICYEVELDRYSDYRVTDAIENDTYFEGIHVYWLADKLIFDWSEE